MIFCEFPNSLTLAGLSCVVSKYQNSAMFFAGYRPRFVHTRPARSLSVEFEGQIYDIDLQADDQSAVRRRVISKRHYNAEDPEFNLGSDDGSEEMLADDTNAVGYPNSVKVTHK